jgi:hypothetical protein
MAARPSYAERLRRANEEALSALVAACPEPFPDAVFAHAAAAKRVPATPSRAMALYWGDHPLLADGIARRLAAASGAPPGWTWRLDPSRAGFLPHTARVPPTPYREPEHLPEAGRCQICGGLVYRLGWHEDPWGDGRLSPRGRWHGACVAAWGLWNAPASHLMALKRAQGHRCAVSGRRLRRDAEVDHRVPLYRVWRDERDRPWPDLLAFWGAPNLQVIGLEAHRDKSAREADERARRRAAA